MTEKNAKREIGKSRSQATENIVKGDLGRWGTGRVLKGALGLKLRTRHEVTGWTRGQGDYCSYVPESLLLFSEEWLGFWTDVVGAMRGVKTRKRERVVVVPFRAWQDDVQLMGRCWM